MNISKYFVLMILSASVVSSACAMNTRYDYSAYTGVDRPAADSAPTYGGQSSSAPVGPPPSYDEAMEDTPVPILPDVSLGGDDSWNDYLYETAQAYPRLTQLGASVVGGCALIFLYNNSMVRTVAQCVGNCFDTIGSYTLHIAGKSNKLIGVATAAALVAGGVAAYNAYQEYKEDGSWI